MGLGFRESCSTRQLQLAHPQGPDASNKDPRRSHSSLLVQQAHGILQISVDAVRKILRSEGGAWGEGSVPEQMASGEFVSAAWGEPPHVTLSGNKITRGSDGASTKTPHGRHIVFMPGICVQVPSSQH